LVEGIGNKKLEAGWGWGSNDCKKAEEHLSSSPSQAPYQQDSREDGTQFFICTPTYKQRLYRTMIKEEGIKTKYLEKLR